MKEGTVVLEKKSYKTPPSHVLREGGGSGGLGEGGGWRRCWECRNPPSILDFE